MEAPAGAGGGIADTNYSSSSLYERLESYSFVTDPEFKLGLAAILGQTGTPATDEQVNRKDDLVLRAKCFYFSKISGINTSIDFDHYKAWLQAQPSQLPQSTTQPPTEPESSNNDASSSAPNTASATATTAANGVANDPNSPTTQEPAYPSSFARIVELITTGQPIPGIQQIPDTVLTGHEGPSTAKPRRKPWEKEEPESEISENNLNSENGGGADGSGSKDAEKEKANNDTPVSATATAL